MHYHRKQLNKLKHYDETMKRAPDFKYHHCEPELKETTSKSTERLPKDNHQASTNYLKLLSLRPELMKTNPTAENRFI